jgi:hypothetical protein
MQKYNLGILLCAVCLIANASIGQENQQHVKHLVDAQYLLRHVDLQHTSYNHGAPKVVWTGKCELHADCSGFIDALLSHSYGFDADAYKRWFDSHRPSARRYHDAIVEQKGFNHINRVADIHPGDFLAVKYREKEENTGHIMLVAEKPRRMNPKKPIETGTEQWEITVIDSSRSGHGATDTRHKKGKDGKDHDGLGEGILRLYSTADGSVAGFTWSTLSSSDFKPPKDEHLVIGRLKTEFKP